MAIGFSKAAMSRRLRHMGNKASIPNKHPDGNKPSFAKGGPHGRAAASQQSSGGGFMRGIPYQGGAPSATGQKPSPPIPKSGGNTVTPNRGIAKDMQENKARLRSNQGPYGPAIQRRMGM